MTDKLFVLNFIMESDLSESKMDSLRVELKKLAQMSMVKKRKQSFAGIVDKCEHSVNKAEATHAAESAEFMTEPSQSMLYYDTKKELINYDQPVDSSEPLQIVCCDSFDIINTSEEKVTEEYSSPISILSPSVISLQRDESSGTWPRKHRKPSVRFTDDSFDDSDDDMVRQKENGSQLAAASTTDWGDITDNGYIDDPDTSDRNQGASIDDDLVIPNWRKESPIPELGNKNMSWKQRQTKLQDALDWLRSEIGEMKKQDQLLMCQFIQLRSDIHTLKFKSRNKSGINKTNTASCHNLTENQHSPQNVTTTSLFKFQSTMTLNRHRGHERSPHYDQHMMHDDDDDDDGEDDGDDEEEDDDEDRTLTEPEYLPEYRARTMSLLPPVQARRMARMRTTRNKSFSAPGTAENTDRGLTDVIE